MGRWADRAFSDYVYVIAGSHGMVKVGVSADPAARLATLQTGSAHHLHLAYSAPVSGDVYAAEADAHALLSKYRQIGEWFAVPADVAVAAVSAAVFRHSRAVRIGEDRPRWLRGYVALTMIATPLWLFSTPTPFIAVVLLGLMWMNFRFIRSRGRWSVGIWMKGIAVAIGAIVTSLTLAMPFIGARAEDEAAQKWVRKGSALCESLEDLVSAKTGQAARCIAAPTAIPVEIEEQSKGGARIRLLGLGPRKTEAWADPHSLENEPPAEEMSPD